MAITYLDDEPTDTQSRITYLDDEPAPTVEAPLQTPLETGARAAGTGLVESVTGFQSGVGEVRQSLSDLARQYVGETPAEIFDALTVVPRTLGPMARQAGAAAQEFFAPDAERNPKSAAIGSGLGQAPALIGAGFMAGPAAPIAMGAFSGFGSGAETARDMGITDPLAIAGMGAGFAGVEAATERMFGIGNKAATEAMQAAARRSLPQMFGAAARGTLGEGAEEIIAGTGQDALSAAMAPQGYDVSRFQVMDPETGAFNPDYLNRRGLEALGGMAGGAVFSGADALLNARKAPEVLAPVADPLAAAAASFPEAAPTITYLDDATDARFQPPPSLETATSEKPSPTITGSNVQTGTEMPVPGLIPGEAPLSASVTPGPQPTAVLSPAPSELAAGSIPATGAISAELPTAPASVPPTPEPAALSDGSAISSAEGAPPPPPAQPALSPEEIANEQRLYDEKIARFRSAKTMAENKQPIIPDAPYGGYDVLDFVNDNVIKLPPKSERTTGEYDWAETLDLQPKYNRFLFSSRRGSNITAVAQRAFEENLIPDPTPDALMAAIESTARQRDDFQAEMDAQEERLKQMEAEIGAPLDSPGAGAWADSVIADSMETPFIGIDPRLMAAYTVKGAQLIREGVTSFTKWSAEMVKRFGAKVRDYLQDVWMAARKTSERGSIGGDPLNDRQPQQTTANAESTDLTPSEWSAPRTDPVLLTNAAEAERLISEGKAPGPTGNQGTIAGWKAEAAVRMDEPGAGPALVSDLIAKGRAHTPVEYFMLEIYAGALDIQLDESSSVLADPLSTAEARSYATAQILAADIERDRVEIASRVSGSQMGAAFRARRSAMAREEIPPLKKMVADLTLINDPTGQTPLAPEERRKVEKIHTDMVAAKEARDAQRETGTGGAEDTYKLELEKLLKEAREQLAFEQAENKKKQAVIDYALNKPASKITLSKAASDRIKTAADAARARLAAKGIRFSANPFFDIETITDYSIILADYIREGAEGTARGIRKLVEMVGDEIKPFLNQIKDKADIYLEQEKQRKTPAGIKEKAAADIASGKGAPADLARQLALAHITDHLARQDKTMSAEKIADLVRADLEALQPGITTREARDLISGYGKTTKPAQEEAQRTLRDYKAQMRKLTQIEALRAGEPLKRTGPQRDEPTARQRELSKLLEELKRETGYQPRSREEELASIRDRIKRTLENQIEDLQRVLSGQARPTAPRERFLYDADLQALQTLRNNLQTLVEEMPAHKLATEQRRNRAAISAAQASEAEFKRRMASKEWSRASKILGPATEAVQNARDLAAQARNDYQTLKKEALKDDAIAKRLFEARQLAAFKRRLQRQIDNIEKRIKEGDFEAKKRTPRQIKHDEQSAALNLKLQERKREFIDLKIKQRMANMGLLGKSVEWFRTGIFTLRSIMAGGEFSAIGRQGILKALSHPIRFIGDLKAMTRAFQSKVGEQQMIDELWARPNAINGRYKVAGLALHNPDDYSELLAEGAARSALSDKIPWFSHTARAYTGLLNHMRADMFDMLVEKRSRKGQEDLSEATLRNLADFVNDSTGAGKLGFGKHVLRGTARDVASTLMFSPSFFMSRLRLLTGASLIGADKRTVAVIAPEYAKMAAGYLALFTLLNALRDAGEDELEKDIRSGAFLKMDFGKTSVDLMAGLSQMATFWARLISGQTKSRGEVVDIRGPNRPYNATDVPGVIWRFARSKESPQASVVFDWMTGEDSMGNPVDFSKPETWMKSAREMATPMVFNSIREIRAAEPAPRAAALSAAAMIGIGTNVRNP